MKTMNHHEHGKHEPPWLWKTWNHDHGKPEPPWLWKTQTTTLENMNHHEHGKKPCTWFEARPCRKTWTWKTYEPPWTCMNHHVHGKMENLSMRKKTWTTMYMHGNSWHDMLQLGSRLQRWDPGEKNSTWAAAALHPPEVQTNHAAATNLMKARGNNY